MVEYEVWQVHHASVDRVWQEVDGRTVSSKSLGSAPRAADSKASVSGLVSIVAAIILPSISSYEQILTDLHLGLPSEASGS